MFTRILVPLDGSRLAEAALPAAEAVRKAFGSSVTLIHLLENAAPSGAHGERHLSSELEAGAYLEETARRFFPPGSAVERHVHAGGISDVPLSLTEHSQELHQDLIVMCVHGPASLERAVSGSVAQRIVTTQTVPVLLVRPGAGTSPVPFRTALVALDGTPAHEQGLPVAAELSRAGGVQILLSTVVPTVLTLMGAKRATGVFLPVATAELLEITEESAEQYLAGCARRLAESGVVVRTAVRRGNPARQLVRLAQESGSDLIILGTHGRAGSRAFWAGSIAHRIITRTNLPLLLIPAGDSYKENP
jgi:nucleotide-binding universal stress UspA family protein